MNRAAVLVLAAGLGVGGMGSLLLAQVPTAVTTPAGAPVLPQPTTTDEEVLGIVKVLVGSFQAEAAGSQPALHLHAAAVNIEGLDNAVYFEIARADSAHAPFRQGVWHVYRQALAGGGSALTLRVMDFRAVGQKFGGAVAFTWLVPDFFPVLKADQLSVNVDIPLTKTASGYEGTSAPSSTTGSGATLLTAQVKLERGKLTFIDRGVNAAGAEVFGPGISQPGATFTPYTHDIKVRRKKNGLVIIDVREGPKDSPMTEDGAKLALEFSGWVLSSGEQFDSTREREQPLQTTLPGQSIPGWNQGLPGIRKGGIRRLIIPASLGFGAEGNRGARIPANSTLMLELECVYHQPGPPLPPPMTPMVPEETDE